MFDLDKDYIKANMMGPNSIVILDELVKKSQFKSKKAMRVLDLGCGMGLTSIYLAKQFNVEVFAVDLWISATDNYARFKELGLDSLIVPINCDANNLPFAEDYFDAVISVDSYHYFGNNDTYFHEKIQPLVKNNADVLLAFPSLKADYTNNIPEEMKPYWNDEAVSMWQSTNWWKDNFTGKLADLTISEMSCFDRAWKDWLDSDSEYAVEDREMMAADSGRYMNLISIVGKINK